MREKVRWYQGYLCRGNQEQVIKKISLVVKRYGLGHCLPVLRAEKKPPTREFYVFLGFESEQRGKVPEAARAPLQAIRELGHPTGVLELDAIKQMVTKEMAVYNYAGVIAYFKRRQLPDEDPFANYENDEDLLGSSDVYGRLLVWLSAVGRCGWSTFRGACQTLGLDPTKVASRPILRRMKLLGHVETGSRGKNVSVNPSVFGRVQNSGQEIWIHYGQRSPNMIPTLEDAGATVRVTKQAGAPPLVEVSGLSEQSLRKVMNETHFVEQAGLTLARALPDLEGWMETLESFRSMSLSNFEVLLHSEIPGARNHETDEPFQSVTFTKKSGFYMLINQTSRQKMHFFYDSHSDRWLKGDWYGLRYLHFYSAGIDGRGIYKPATREFLIPSEYRWPELYERALVLASGRVPRANKGWTSYSGVSPDLVTELEEKLCLEIEEK